MKSGNTHSLKCLTIPEENRNTKSGNHKLLKKKSFTKCWK